jgi:hypothetical protein
MLGGSRLISLVGAALGVVAFLCNAGAARAGTVILEGSDAIGLHCIEGNASACTYTGQVWKALDGSSALPIAVIGNVAGITSQGSGVTIDNFASVAAAGTLSKYAALYFVATGGCCTENDSLITAAGAQAAVSAYIMSGGTVMIENYIGGTAWDFAVGAGGLADTGTNTAGFGTADPTFSCSDGETVTPTGTTNGFTQPGAIGCWDHQAYKQSFYGGLTSINGSGFTLSFFNADPTAGEGPGYSGLLSDGTTLSAPPPPPPGVPEPASALIFGVGLLGLGFVANRKRS